MTCAEERGSIFQLTLEARSSLMGPTPLLDACERRRQAGWYMLPRSDSSSFLVARMPSGSPSRLSFVLDPDEAVIAGIGDDLHDPGEVELGLLARFVEIVALGRDPLGIGHHPGDRVVDVDRVLARLRWGKLPKSGRVPKAGLPTAFIKAIMASGLLDGPP